MVWRLDQRQLGVVQKRTNGGLQEYLRGDVIAVENADQLAAGLGQGMVEVARLA